MIFIIENNPENEVYDALMDLAFETCNEFHLVLRRDMGNIRALDPILEKLRDSLIEMRLESKWASTILGDDNKAEVYFFIQMNMLKTSLKNWRILCMTGVYQNQVHCLKICPFLKTDGLGW